ncbi:hypothetical protein CRG98_028125 [Punica granatum]|uniref:Retrotransposon Copia-like N-terminal domain-containing protein n=1 Tax=Punica granatum TaxID=22663 RepID=A0A2I0J5Q5_PUNGR|nr:hypothetical protein CRG98_028125 [Punica granatum]
MALCAKNKVGFIDGTLFEPGNRVPNKPLCMANSLVVTWIVNSLEKDLQPSIACIENAWVLWEDLRHFAQGNEMQIYQLKGQQGRSWLHCDYYNQTGHARSTCYKLNRRPITAIHSEILVAGTVSPSETWIIDTGAFSHMTDCPHFLFDSSP